MDCNTTTYHGDQYVYMYIEHFSILRRCFTLWGYKVLAIGFETEMGIMIILENKWKTQLKYILHTKLNQRPTVAFYYFEPHVTTTN